MASDIKKAFIIARNAYFDWVTNPRIFLFFLAVMVIINSYITPILNYARNGAASPLNIWEGFLSICSDARVVGTILILVFLVLMCDFPKMSANDTFVLIRSSKTTWVMGQTLFAFFAALSYVAALCLVVSLYTAPFSFFKNGWSIPVRLLSEAESSVVNQYGISACVYKNVFNHTRPMDALFHSIVLMTLALMALAMIILLFNLKGKKMIGVVTAAVVTVVGYTLLFLKSDFQWLFPLSHSIINSHNTSVMKVVPLWQSYVYFFIVLAAFIALAAVFIDKYSFRFNDSTN